MGAKADVMRSLQSSPLGTGDMEGGLQAPFNAPREHVVVKVRNLSALQKRRYVIEPISWLRGGEQYADEMQQKGKFVNLETLQKRAAHGADVSPTEVAVKPVDVFLTFDNAHYYVPAVDDKTGEKAPWVDVPDGVYDLYVGNFQRLNDPRERAKELERVKSRRKDYVVRAGDKNEYAFLEFSYEVIQPTAIAVDKERIYAGEVVEV